MITLGMGALVIAKCLQKIWCGTTIQGCSTLNIISRNKDKTLRIVPQCGTNRVNTVIIFMKIVHVYF